MIIIRIILATIFLPIYVIAYAIANFFNMDEANDMETIKDWFLQLIGA